MFLRRKGVGYIYNHHALLCALHGVSLVLETLARNWVFIAALNFQNEVGQITCTCVVHYEHKITLICYFVSSYSQLATMSSHIQTCTVLRWSRSAAKRCSIIASHASNSIPRMQSARLWATFLAIYNNEKRGGGA